VNTAECTELVFMMICPFMWELTNEHDESC